MAARKIFLLWLVVVALLVGCAHTPSGTPVATADLTALDRYVAKPDDAYGYELVNTYEGKSSTGYVFDMASQRWRSEDEIDRTLWRHWVTVAVPDKVTSRTALLIIGGGSDASQAPKGGDAELHRIARATNAVVATIKQIPNQRLTFKDDGRGRSEDSLIAYTWDKYLKTGDEEWPARLPMTKAVVRAMDTIQAFCVSAEGGDHPIDSFVVAGASKRGWTTWTTAVVDNRVVAIVPIVIDLLNIVPSFEHHKAVYGFWAPAINDYVRFDIMDWMGTPEYDALMAIVEPYSYLDRLTMPKLLMNSCGDQFFIPDSAQFYENDLQGPTWFRYVPNTGHGLDASAYDSLQSFFHAVIARVEIPTYRWSYPDVNTIRVETSAKPTAVKLWQATNPEARDFRFDQLGKAYQATELSDQGGGVYVGHVDTPGKGWRAFMVELTFAGPGDVPFIFTTPVHVVPDEYPHTYERTDPLPVGFLSKDK